ncbi:hypothetical protein DFR52_103403 [Hoeflea marina]|uniref:EF-hand domain-containing protein n=1 Tax=Hoeflea marina TaxID=274592 RepID=A0A317PNX8_9HYPH|nr:hypothetical protein [Hoeflea marina]PWW00201.1 hypothetical protein DFR52_103403 [Hoeflea marina]
MRTQTLLTAMLIGMATPAALAGPAADFRAADANGNRQLEFDEFRVFVDLRANGGNAQAKKVRLFKAYRLALGKVDYDGDGIVTGDELIRFDRANGKS